jgi:hypothetical protein
MPAQAEVGTPQGLLTILQHVELEPEKVFAVSEGLLL